MTGTDWEECVVICVVGLAGLFMAWWTGRGGW